MKWMLWVAAIGIVAGSASGLGQNMNGVREAGRIGVRTKADSVTEFDDLRIVAGDQ